MIAVDTNVLVRLVVRDDAVQAGRAAALFEQNEIYICKTVLLETEWVLRFSYELDGAAILAALRGVVGLPQVSVEDSLAVAEALDCLETGMDFADALHEASSPEAAQFATETPTRCRCSSTGSIMSRTGDRSSTGPWVAQVDSQARKTKNREPVVRQSAPIISGFLVQGALDGHRGDD